LNVTRVVLLDTLCRTLIELRRALADAKSDEQKFIDAAKDIIREAIAAEDVAIEEEAMVVEAVIEDLRFALRRPVGHSPEIFDERNYRNWYSSRDPLDSGS